MATHEKYQAVERSRKIYQRLLAFYPKAHRDSYGQPMAQLFGDQCRDAWNTGRSWGLLRLWMRVLPDFVKTSIGEHISALKRKRPTSEIADLDHVPVASWMVFKRVFAGVFLLTFISTVLVTLMLPKTFEGRAVVMLRTDSSLTNRVSGGVIAPTPSYDLHFIETGFKLMQSKAILGRVIEKLELNRRWGKRYANGKELRTSETMEKLRERVEIRPLNNRGIFKISVLSEDPKESADIANAIAESCINSRFERNRQVAADNNALVAPSFRFLFVELAKPALGPTHPNKPRSIVLGAFGGIALAVAAGAITLGVASAIRRIKRPRFVAT